MFGVSFMSFIGPLPIEHCAIHVVMFGVALMFFIPSSIVISVRVYQEKNINDARLARGQANFICMLKHHVQGVNNTYIDFKTCKNVSIEFAAQQVSDTRVHDRAKVGHEYSCRQ